MPRCKSRSRSSSERVLAAARVFSAKRVPRETGSAAGTFFLIKLTSRLKSDVVKANPSCYGPASSSALALEFSNHFLQHVRDGDMLRAKLHALAAFLAVGRSLFLLEDVEVEELGSPPVPVNREVVQLQEIGRDADAVRAGETVAATGAVHPGPRLINRLGLLDQRQFLGGQRVG